MSISWVVRRWLYKLYYRYWYLHSPHWLLFRAKLIEKVGGVCEVSGCTSNHVLQGHHLNYLRVGKEKPADVVILCRKHHGLVHRGFVYKFKKRK